MRDKLEKLLNSKDPKDIALVSHYLNNPYLQFTPRPDRIDDGDEHTRYCTDTWRGVKCVVGGNACHATNTIVRMFDGTIKLVQDVILGDLVMGEDGTERKVLELHKGKGQLYKITPYGKRQKYKNRFSEDIVVNENHILHLHRTSNIVDKTKISPRYENSNYHLGKGLFEISVKDFMKQSYKFRHSMCQTRIPHKKCPIGKRNRNSLRFRFEIEDAGMGDYYGFTLDKPLFLLGNGMVQHNSSKTYTTAWLVANFLFTQPPPRPLTPFYVVSSDYPTCGQIYQAKLSKFITQDQIHHIRWRSVIEQHPSVVVLKPDAKGNSWALYFHSYEQGREAFQSKDAGGFWCDEQCGHEILIELLTRCRVFYFPNSMYYSLTPVEFDEYLEDLMKRRNEPEVANLWKFYRLNTQYNQYNSPEWFKAWSESLPSDMRACRLRGDFLHFEGLIYKEFADKHIIAPMPIPEEAKLYLGVDHGFRNAAVVWVYEFLGNWYVYDELLLHDILTEDMAKQIKDKHWSPHTKVWSDWEDAGAMARMKEQNIMCLPAIKDVNVGIESMRIKLIGQAGIPQLFVYDNCVETIKEFKRYTWQKVPKKPLNPTNDPDKPVKKDDHLLDALRYVIHSEVKSLTKPWKGITMKPKTHRFLEGGR